jgi:A/G-specific adenine glycosylase
MKAAAGIIAEKWGGRFPEEAKELLLLPGIGPYTAGAIASIAFGKSAPAVDGNVLRVFARMNALSDNILLPAVRKRAEQEIGEVMRVSVEAGCRAGDISQSLIELGALVCLPGPAPLCRDCPVRCCCEAHRLQLEAVLPVRIKKTDRRIEKRTVLLIRDGEEVAVSKRPETGLLAGLYEFPNTEGYLSEEEAIRFAEERGGCAVRIRKLPDAKHLFSHVEWQMRGFEVRISRAVEQEKEETGPQWVFARTEEIENHYAIPSAFSAYTGYLLQGSRPGGATRKEAKERRQEDENINSRNPLL